MASSRVVPIIEAGGVPLAPDLRAALERLVTLGDVLAWGRAQTPPRAPVEFVTQLEYTHDVVLARRDDCSLVFDTTCLVSVTALKGGERILGYAACVVSAEHRHRRPGA